MSTLQNVSTERLKRNFKRLNRSWHELQDEILVNRMDPFNMNAQTAAYFEKMQKDLNHAIERIGRELDNRARYGGAL